MEGKELRIQRTKEFFIEAACEIIESDGMEMLTIRNIAKKAGYNSASMYSYFDNLAHVTSIAGDRFVAQIVKIVLKECEERKPENPLVKWALLYELLALYLIANRNIFHCLFFGLDETLEEKANQIDESDVLFFDLVRDSVLEISKKTGHAMSQLVEIHKACLALMVGYLLLLDRNKVGSGMSNEDLADTLHGQVLLLISSNLEAM